MDKKKPESMCEAMEELEESPLHPMAGTEAFDQMSIDVRSAGFCLECHELVERCASGECPVGHHVESIVGNVVLTDERELPQLKRFSWGAFFMPMIWGPAHGIWAGLIVFPLWLFVDSCVRVAYSRGGTFWFGAGIVGFFTLAFMAWFGATSMIPAYLKQRNPVSIEEFNRRQVWWGIAGFIFFVAIIALAVYYNTFIFAATL